MERVFSSWQDIELTENHLKQIHRDLLGSRNTLKQRFRVLVERGHLTAHGAGRGAWYQLR